MKSMVRQTMVFGIACAVTAVGWLIFWPGMPQDAGRQPEATVAALPPVPNRDRWNEIIHELESAATDEAKVDVSNRLEQIPASEFPRIFDELTLVNNLQLTFTAKALLIRWASADGRAAMEWAWQRFRSEGVWENAFKEIGSVWAWHQPAQFAAWVLELAKSPKPNETISIADAEASEEPILEFDLLAKSSGWLMSEDPRLGYQVLLARGGMSSNDGKLAHSLNTVDQIQEALSAFTDLDKIQPNVWKGDQMFADGLFLRWREIDPEDFNKSPYAKLFPPVVPGPSSPAVRNLRSLSPTEHIADADRTITETPAEHRAALIRVIAANWAESDHSTCMQWLASLPQEYSEARILAIGDFIAPHDLVTALDSTDRLPILQRQVGIVRAFDAWTKAHPEERPDMTGWSENRRRAWTDLEALSQGAVRNGGH